MLIASVLALPVLAYGITVLLGYALEGMSLWGYFAIAAGITLIWLAVTYWMVKIGFIAAHEYDPKEPTINLKDVPKDVDQLARSKR